MQREETEEMAEEAVEEGVGVLIMPKALLLIPAIADLREVAEAPEPVAMPGVMEAELFT